MAVQHRGSNWTPDEDRRLLDLVKDKKSWVFISANLKRPAKTAKDRFAYLRRQAKKSLERRARAEGEEMTFVTPRERRQTWTPEEDQRLLALKAAGTPLAVIAETLGRTRASVDARTAKLKYQAKEK